MSSFHKYPIFVYGTLKSQHPNHGVMQDMNNGQAQFLAKCTTLYSWPLVIGTPYNIPFVLDQKGTGKKIHGELYRVDKVMLAALDRLENHPNGYSRKLIEVVIQEKDAIQCVEMYKDNIYFESGSDHKIMCEIYLLKGFKKDLLKLEFLESYHNRSPFLYIPHEKRETGVPGYFYFVKENYIQ